MGKPHRMPSSVMFLWTLYSKIRKSQASVLKKESPTTATTQNAIGNIQGDSLTESIAQSAEDVNAKFSLSDSHPRPPLSPHPTYTNQVIFLYARVSYLDVKKAKVLI